jgi:SAM-dependent methyltransferase
MPTQRRLVFGQVADLYDRSRPSYPPALIDDLIALSGVGATLPALEVGAGTGKATRLMAQRGVSVLAIEPSHEMAVVARRACAAYPHVAFVQSDFETWEPDHTADPFGLVYAGQAWHWVDPAHGYARARQALVDGGLLAVFWNRPVWDQAPLRGVLSETYRTVAPTLEGDGPMHPDNTGIDAEDEWHQAIATAAGFGQAEVRRYAWSLEYSSQQYADMVATLSETRLLEAEPRDELLSAIHDAIAAQGGRLELPMSTRSCTARAV